MKNAFPILFEDQAKYIESLHYVKFQDGVPYIDWQKRFGRKSNEYDLVFYPITALIYRLGTQEPIVNEDLFLGLCCPAKQGECTINFDFPTYQLKKVWKSALGQALFILFLVQERERKDTHHKKAEFDDLIEKSLNLLLDDDDNGGFFDAKNKWFHEYPSEYRELQSYVLNGHLIVISVLLYLTDETNHSSIPDREKRRVRDVITTTWSATQDKLKHYSWGNWSKYCVYKNNVVNEEYHNLHIRLLEYISEKYDGDNTTAERFLASWSKGSRNFHQSYSYRLKIKAKYYAQGFFNRLAKIS